MMILIESVAFIAAFVLLEIVGMDAFLIIMMWLTFACIGLGLIGEFIIRPWREEKRGSPCVRNSISVAPESGRADKL